MKQPRARQDGIQYTTATDSGFEPTFRDFSAMVRVRARSGEKHRRRGAAPLENFKGQIHVFKRHFLSQNNMHSVHNQCIRSILIEICPYPPLPGAEGVVVTLCHSEWRSQGGSRTQGTQPRSPCHGPEHSPRQISPKFCATCAFAPNPVPVWVMGPAG